MDKLFMVTVKVLLTNHEQQFKIRCKPLMVMKVVREKIVTKINTNDFDVQVNDKIISDDITLSQCDVITTKHIDVIEKNKSKNITILVSKLAEKPISVKDVCPDMLINDLKKYIEKIINVPSNKQKLIFNQIILDESKSLSQYNIVNESKIFVAIQI